MDDNKISADLAEHLRTRPTPVRERLPAGFVDNWPDLLKYHEYADRPFPPIRFDPPR